MNLPVKLLKIANKVITPNFSPTLEMFHIIGNKIVFSNAFILVEFYPDETNGLNITKSIFRKQLQSISRLSKKEIIINGEKEGMIEILTDSGTILVEDQKKDFVKYDFDNLLGEANSIDSFYSNSLFLTFVSICNQVSEKYIIKNYKNCFSFDGEDGYGKYRVCCFKL